jgi:hypothetical protein
MVIVTAVTLHQNYGCFISGEYPHNVGMLKNQSEKDALAVSQRLETLLLKKSRTLSPTALAKDFNLRWRGTPVTVNATRKWLTGESIPTMDKLTVLANMLDSSEDWLRWGDKSMQEPQDNNYTPAASIARSSFQNLERSFLQDFRLLSPVHKRLLMAMLEVLLSEQLSQKDIASKK